jgi:hypothetical protein
MLALTSPTIGGRSVGIVRLWTKATEVFFCVCTQLLASEFDSLIIPRHGSQGTENAASLIVVEACYHQLPRKQTRRGTHRKHLSSNGHGADNIENTSCKFMALLLGASISGVAYK